MPFAVILLAFLVAGGGRQQPLDPSLRSAVEQFFATQEAEDLDGYLALWSSSVTKPLPEQLRYIFDSGDDKFIDLQVDRVDATDRLARVRVSVTRARTSSANTNPDGTKRISSARIQVALTLVKEGDGWKLTKEESPTDAMADALVDENDAGRRAAMLAADPDLVNARLLEALTRRADSLAQTARNKAAQEIFVRALEIARAMGDRKAEGRMLQNVATALYFQRDFERALETYQQRLVIEREIANDEGIASALLGIATIRYSTQEYSAALTMYREALAIQERLDDELLVSTTLLSTGNVLYLQADYEGAIADYKRSESLKRKYSDLGGAMSALEGLGRTYAAQGDLAAALLAFSSVFDEAHKLKDRRREAAVLQNIGETHFRLGNLDAARVSFEEGRKQFEALKDLANAGRAAQGTGVTELVAGRFVQAENAYTKSNSLCLDARDDTCIASALVGLAFAQASQQHYEEAIASYRRCIAAFRALGSSESTARAQVGLAEALSGNKDYVAALIEAGNARETATRLVSDDVLWRALVAQARAQRSLKRQEDARLSAAAAVAAVQRMAAQALARPGDPVPRDTASAFVTAAILEAEAGEPSAAFEIVEQMRAHALRVALATNERDIAGGLSDAERDEERIAAAELRARVAQMARARSLPKPDPARIAKLETDLAAASQKRSAIQDRLFARIPDLRTWRGLAVPVAAADLDPLLNDGALMVQFVVDDHDLLIITATRVDGRPVFTSHTVSVERHALAERVARAVDPSALGDVARWRTAASELFKLVPPEVLTQLTSATTVTIVPDDVLWRVPFEAMPVGTRYLADVTTVKYASSATTLVRAPSSDASPELRVLIVAAPELPADTVEMLTRTSPSWTLRPSTNGEQEAERVTEAGDGNVTGNDETQPGGRKMVTALTGASATEGALRQGGGTASVLHIAAPFRINAAGPLFSPVLLGRPERADSPDLVAADNGMFEVREVPTAGLTARTVLFSDPSTLAMRDAPASVPVVQWIWRAGGVETLVLRRWGADDRVTSELLATFHHLLRDGKTSPEAMRLACARLRNSPTPPPPAVWAGWLVLTGR